MNRENIMDASDKLNVLYNKISFISSLVMHMKHESYTLNSSDIYGFEIVIGELQDEVKKIQELID